MSEQSKRAPTNTAAQEKLDFLAEGLLFGPEKAILRQEAGGQAELVASDVLPTNLLDNARAILEAAGVKFGEPVPGDPIFQYVELPAGWRKVPTEHSMWSDLVDERGRVRAHIFYKAAFYDRSAHLVVATRFSVDWDYKLWDAQHETRAIVRDGGTVVYTTPVQRPDPALPEAEAFLGLVRRVEGEARQWVEARYPEWRDPGAYWEVGDES